MIGDIKLSSQKLFKIILSDYLGKADSVVFRMFFTPSIGEINFRIVTQGKMMNGA